MSRSIIFRIALVLLLVCTNALCQTIRNLEYQNDGLLQNLGIGLVQIRNVNKSIPIYSDRNLSKMQNGKIGTHVIPLLYKPDYGILFFSCIEKKSGFYKIAISKDKYAYIKVSENHIFYPWEDFLKNQVISITSKNLKTNPPRDSIEGKAILKSGNADDETEILEVRNEWLKVKNTHNNQVFWIKWRDDKTLKIFLNLLI